MLEWPFMLLDLDFSLSFLIRLINQLVVYLIDQSTFFLFREYMTEWLNVWWTDWVMKWKTDWLVGWLVISWIMVHFKFFLTNEYFLLKRHPCHENIPSQTIPVVPNMPHSKSEQWWHVAGLWRFFFTNECPWNESLKLCPLLHFDGYHETDRIMRK